MAHVGIARGAAEVEFLRKRHAALVTRRPFADTVFTDDPAHIAQWLPLVMEGRDRDEPIAVTRNDTGTDVNFGALSKVLFDGLRGMGVDVRTGHEVTDLERASTGGWNVAVRNRASGERSRVTSGFVFVGAGGAALHLLQKSGIREIRGVGGFPVSGQFLRCTNPELVEQHHAKVYGRPATGAPPMTAPHLDSRVIDGRRGLMFGPFAGFTPKFLKQGSLLDLARSVRQDNILTMLNVARHELPLTAYLIRQVLQTTKARVEQLRRFVPDAREGDWELIHAGQRVQVMRPTATSRGVLQFGTEVITSEDGTISGLLGASPGASTATAIMLDVLKRCFPREWSSWHPVLKDVVPSLGISLADEPALFEELHQRSERVLQLGTRVPV